MAALMTDSYEVSRLPSRLAGPRVELPGIWWVDSDNRGQSIYILYGVAGRKVDYREDGR